MSGLKNVCAIIIVMIGEACATQPPGPPEALEYITLERSGVAVTITPAFGGRVTGFGLAGRDSMVLFDATLAAEQPAPPVEISAAALPYQGQSLWVGPQSEWWTHQTAAPEMQGEAWPPDPYLTTVKMRVTRTPYSVTLQGPASPHTGLKVRQTYELLESGCLKLTAVAENTRQTPVSWDLWTNIRVPGDAWVFAPVADAAAIRPGPTNDPAFQPPQLGYAEGLAFADPSMEGVTAPAREGKVLLDPDQGWMAGVRDGQAFRVSFALRPLEDIRPAQGRVEFYFNQPSDKSDAGVIEMETHAPYRTLRPGETMQAEQFWSVQPVSEASLSSGHLNSLARDLGERDACRSAS